MPDKDPKKVQLGHRIRELRESACVTREQLAKAAGVSERAVVQWELGEREPGWFNILALCEALGVDCRAFTVVPSEAPEPRRGRPRKAAQEKAPQRPRGRKPKGE